MITAQYPYTRRFFEKEEVIISSCNSCFSAVAESDDEAELDTLRTEHSCANQTASKTLRRLTVIIARAFTLHLVSISRALPAFAKRRDCSGRQGPLGYP